ncbi:MAG: hypothetical protein NW223_23535 [Hyphomicrobiaceae bacterium]|nr:hypothetical protein [Hyphomicrobiaceae bacterium]
MGRFITSFGIGFAAAALIAVALSTVMRPAQAGDHTLGDWLGMSPEAKLEHARQVAGNGPARMETARAILFCLHDAARPSPGLSSEEVESARRQLNLNDAVNACRSSLRG